MGDRADGARKELLHGNAVSLGFLELSALQLVTGCMVTQSDMAHASTVSLSGALNRSAALANCCEIPITLTDPDFDEEKAQTCVIARCRQ